MYERRRKVMETDTIIHNDCLDALKDMPSESVHCCVTSPPYYGLRDYGMDGQVGREATPEQYIRKLTEIFSEVYRVLRADGTCWLNISDTYCGTGSKGGYKDPKNPEGRNGQNVSIVRNVEGCKHKDLIGIPWMLAFALRNSGWYLRNDIVWQKGNAMPESAKDNRRRFVKPGGSFFFADRRFPRWCEYPKCFPDPGYRCLFQYIQWFRPSE